MCEPLSDKQLAELRAFVEVGQKDTTMPVSFLAPHFLRLLDEVERLREMADDVALLTLDYRDPTRMAALERLKQRVSEKLRPPSAS